MHRDLREDVFDLVFTAALEEYVDRESANETYEQELNPSKRGLKKLKRAAKAKEHRQPMPVVYLRRVAVVFLAAATLFAGLMATSVEVRAVVKDTVIEWYDKFVRFTFGGGGENENVLYDLEIGYVPDGFELTEVVEEPENRLYTYLSGSGYYVIIKMNLSPNTVYYADNEYTDYTSITINESEANVFYNIGSAGGAVVLEKDGYVISVSGTIDRVELIKITEKIS